MILLPTNKRIIRPCDKPSFEHTQRYGLIKGHPLGLDGGLVLFPIMNEDSGNQVFDLSGNRNTGTFVGSAPSWSSGKFGSVINLPGTNEYIEVGDIAICNLTHVGSVFIWAKITNAANTVVAISKGNIYYDRNGYGLYTYGGAWYAEIAWENGYTQATLAGSVTANVWEHIGLVWDGIKVYLYKNGLQVSSANQTLDATPSGLSLRIGCNGNVAPSNYWTGQLDAPVIFNRALSASEIAQLYREPFCMVERRTSKAYFFVPSGAPPAVKPWWYYHEMMRRAS